MKSFILVILATIAGVWSGPMSVTLDRDRCVLRGASTLINCMYDYPFLHIVQRVGWSKSQQIFGLWRLIPLDIFQSPPGRYQYVGNKWDDCRLQISDVQLADAGSYYFSFQTTLGQLTSETPTQLSVKELTAAVGPSSSVVEGDSVSLTCVSGCPNPVDMVWFRDGKPVMAAVFRSRRGDAGRYHCAVRGQEKIRSASVALSVMYPPDRVTLSISPSGHIIRGTSVVLTCGSDANPPVSSSGYTLYREGRFVGFGQNHTIAEVQPDHSGRYHCQAWNSISSAGTDVFPSAVVLLQVYYPPVNVSVWTEPARAVWGRSVNMSCSSSANPPAQNYTWFRRTDASGPSGLQVGSGQVLYISSMEASLSGLYLCQARNQLGEKNSSEVLLAMVEEEQQGSLVVPVLAGLGLTLTVAFAFALFLFWRNKKRLTQKKEAEQDFSGKQPDNEPHSIYANIRRASPPPPDIALYSQQLSHSQQHSRSSMGSEVTYSSVNFMSRGSARLSDSTDVQASRSSGGSNAGGVIYATLKPG